MTRLQESADRCADLWRQLERALAGGHLSENSAGITSVIDRLIVARIEDTLIRMNLLENT